MLHVIGLPASFTDTLMCLYRKDELIGFPKIAITLATFVCVWNLLPKFTAGCLTPITDDKSHNLACPTAHDRPNPAFVPFFVDKRPHFIGFQHIFGFGRQKRIFKFWVGFVFFLATTPASDDLRQRCVGHRACWIVHDRQTKSVLSVLPCIHVSVPAHHVFRSLCTRIVDCHSHYVHF